MARDLTSVGLTLFFTRGVSLRAWEDVGLLDREVALYRRLEPQLRAVTFTTYGDRRDRAYADRLGGIRVRCNRWHLSPEIYEGWLTEVVPWSWRGLEVIKSNQIQGADVAMKAARKGKKRFIARCGYLLSDNMARAHGAESPQANYARNLERRVFLGADRAVVTTSAMREKVVRLYGVLPERVKVIPNYVDTDRFVPRPFEQRRPHRICYVGRLDPEKNPEALIEAIDGMDVELTMIGTGSLEESLRQEVRERSLPVQFLGNVPNGELPRWLNESSIFVLPSLIEGHPKALLEAMACGRPVIGTNVPGVRELISDRRTGVLCEPNPESLRAAIQEVLGNPWMAAQLGSAARLYVADRFSLNHVAELEIALLDDLLVDLKTPQAWSGEKTAETLAS